MKVVGTQLSKHITVVTLGIIAGWLSQSWFDQPSDQNNFISITTEKASLQIENAVAGTTANEPAAELFKENQTEQGSEPELTAIMLMQNLSLMDDRTFAQYLNDSRSRKRMHSKELVMGLLAELPTISDSASWYRIVDFLAMARLESMNNGEHAIENWIINKVRNLEHEQYWLEVLSNFGLESTTNIEFLTARLDSLPNSESRVSALLALSKNFGFEFRDTENGNNNFSKSSVNRKIVSFLDSDDEFERAAAISVLGTYPSSDLAERITTALQDPSERVRISAMMTLIGSSRPNEEGIKQGLMISMQAEDASDLERLTAWQILKIMPIEGNYYEAVYEFGKNDQHRLSKRYRSRAKLQRSQWGY